MARKSYSHYCSHYLCDFTINEIEQAILHPNGFLRKGAEKGFNYSCHYHSIIDLTNNTKKNFCWGRHMILLGPESRWEGKGFFYQEWPKDTHNILQQRIINFGTYILYNIIGPFTGHQYSRDVGLIEITELIDWRLEEEERRSNAILSTAFLQMSLGGGVRSD